MSQKTNPEKKVIKFLKKNKISNAIEEVIDFKIEHFPEVDFSPALKKSFSVLIALKKLLKAKK